MFFSETQFWIVLLNSQRNLANSINNLNFRLNKKSYFQGDCVSNLEIAMIIRRTRVDSPKIALLNLKMM